MPRKRDKAYYDANREAILAKKREYYVANRAAKLDYQAKRREDPAYRAAMQLYRTKWAAENPDKMAEARRKWYEANYVPFTAEPLAEYWPYGHTSGLLDRVNAVVPRGIPEYLRADICQELCTMVLEGQIDEAGVSEAIPHVRYTLTGKYNVPLSVLPGDLNAYAIDCYA